MKLLDRHIEALIFAAEQPISFKEIRVCLDELFQKKYSKKEIEQSLESLIDSFQRDDTSFEILGRFDNSDIRGCNLLIS